MCDIGELARIVHIISQFNHVHIPQISSLVSKTKHSPILFSLLRRKRQSKLGVSRKHRNLTSVSSLTETHIKFWLLMKLNFASIIINIGSILFPPVFFMTPVRNYMLLHSTLLCTKIARAPGGHERFMLTKLGGGGQNRSEILNALLATQLITYLWVWKVMLRV